MTVATRAGPEDEVAGKEAWKRFQERSACTAETGTMRVCYLVSQKVCGLAEVFVDGRIREDKKWGGEKKRTQGEPWGPFVWKSVVGETCGLLDSHQKGNGRKWTLRKKRKTSDQQPATKPGWRSVNKELHRKRDTSPARISLTAGRGETVARKKQGGKGRENRYLVNVMNDPAKTSSKKGCQDSGKR